MWAVELSTTTVPAPERSSAGSSAWVTRTVPSTLTSYIHCQSAIFAAAMSSLPRAPPALLTSRVSSPPRESTVDTSVATSAGSVTSAVTAVAPISLASASRRSVRRAAMITWKPSAASRRAVAAPIPLDPPVINAMGFDGIRPILSDGGDLLFIGSTS